MAIFASLGNLAGVAGDIPIIGGTITEIFGGEAQAVCQGVTYCVKNRKGLNCSNLQQILASVPAQLQAEWLQTLQKFVSEEWDRKSGNSQKNNLPRQVRIENATGATLYLLGGENDCDFGGLEKNWESAWDQWKAKAVTALATLDVTGGPVPSPIPGPARTEPPATTSDPCAGLPEPIRTTCRAINAGAGGAREGFETEFRREQLAGFGGLGIETVFLIVGVFVLFLVLR